MIATAILEQTFRNMARPPERMNPMPDVYPRHGPLPVTAAQRAAGRPA
jgi:hypothetical protein